MPGILLLPPVDGGAIHAAGSLVWSVHLVNRSCWQPGVRLTITSHGFTVIDILCHGNHHVTASIILNCRRSGGTPIKIDWISCEIDYFSTISFHVSTVTVSFPPVSWVPISFFFSGCGFTSPPLPPSISFPLFNNTPAPSFRLAPFHCPRPPNEYFLQ